MKVFTTISRSSWMTGLKAVPCSESGCRRWLTQRALDSRKVGVTLDGAWFCSYRCVARALEAKLQGLLLSPGRRADPSPRMPLGLLLVSRGQLSETQLRAATEQERDAGFDLGELLVRLGFVSERQVTSARAEQWGCPVFSPGAEAQPVAVRFPAVLAQEFKMAPMHVFETGKRVLIGFSHGVAYGALHAMEQQLRCRAQACIVSPSDLENQITLQVTRDESLIVNDAASVLEMTRMICNEGASVDGDQLQVVRCGGFLWARFHSGRTAHDVLIHAGERNLSRLMFDNSGSNLICS